MISTLAITGFFSSEFSRLLTRGRDHEIVIARLVSAVILGLASVAARRDGLIQSKFAQFSPWCSFCLR